MTAYRSLYVMGTRLEVVFPGMDDEMADAVFNRISIRMKEDEKKLSIYHPDTLFSKINRQASQEAFQLDEPSFQLISDLMDYSRKTRGFFDPTLGILKKDLFGESETETETMLTMKAEERIVLNREDMTVKFQHPLVKLDPGGFGKGYGLENLKKILFSYKIKDAFISFGDSSVMTIGRHPAGDYWKIGIRNPLNDDENAWVFQMNEGSVSTSGNSRHNRSRTHKGHIYNPGKQRFETRKSLVSVQGPSALDAEVLSTALFVAGENERQLILENFPQYKAIEIVYLEDIEQTEIKELN